MSGRKKDEYAITFFQNGRDVAYATVHGYKNIAEGKRQVKRNAGWMKRDKNGKTHLKRLDNTTRIAVSNRTKGNVKFHSAIARMNEKNLTFEDLGFRFSHRKYDKNGKYIGGKE